MAGMTPQHYLNSADAANVLDVSRERVRQLHADGKLKADVYVSGMPGFSQETLGIFASTQKRRGRHVDGDPCNGCGVPLTRDTLYQDRKCGHCFKAPRDPGPSWCGACREQHRKNAQRRKGTIPDPADSGALTAAQEAEMIAFAASEAPGLVSRTFDGGR